MDYWQVLGKVSFLSKEEAEKYCLENLIPLDCIMKVPYVGKYNRSADFSVINALSTQRLDFTRNQDLNNN